MTGELASSLIQTGGTVFAAALAAWFVIHQIRVSKKLELKLEIYKEVLRATDLASSAYGEASTKASVMQHGVVAVWLNLAKFGNFRPAPSIDAITMSNIHGGAIHSAADLLILIENWTVIDPRIRVFHSALNVAAFEVRKAWEPLTPFLFRVTEIFSTPDERTEGHPAYKEDWKGFDAALTRYVDALSLLDCYVSDLRTEMQNALIGRLFGHKAPSRLPIDTRFRTVTLKDHKRLTQFFEHDTAWGKEMQAINARTKAQLLAEGKEVQ